MSAVLYLCVCIQKGIVYSMEQILYFYQLFPSCECSGELADLLSDTVVRRANIDVENRYILQSYTLRYISRKENYMICRYL